MELTMRTATPAERLYTTGQSMQIQGQTGCVGYFQADMREDGKGFFPKWSSCRERLNTEEFQHEFNGVMEALIGDKQYGGFLRNCDASVTFWSSSGRKSLTASKN